MRFEEKPAVFTGRQRLGEKKKKRSNRRSPFVVWWLRLVSTRTTDGRGSPATGDAPAADVRHYLSIFMIICLPIVSFIL